MESDSFGVRVIGPEVEHLVEDALVFLGGSAAISGALNTGAAGIDSVVDGLAQASYFSCSKEIFVADITITPLEIGVLRGGWAS